MSRIRKLLVANRGEIAIRNFRAAREMGIRTVAVYSEADAESNHTRMADEAVLIGGPEPRESYLRIDAVIAAARQTGADAIHPGYGFLSERAEFAVACREAGITFLGPSPESMQALGDKISAKSLAEANDVPITPGLFRAGASDQELLAKAREMGYPVMLKASAGGGGRGMRAVYDDAQIEAELATARDEAEKAFGDGAMMVEKLIVNPRHIEVQLIADMHGTVAVLFERECTLQRRHQKIVEEAPSPIMTEALWRTIREASIRLAQAANYVGAGTVEFIYDPSAQACYFLEVNARLQVEHPVTELITGLDLVQLQIAVAQGERLQDLIPSRILEGDRSAIVGHAIEARIVAEDPSKGFMPSIGRVVGWSMPQMPGVRVDTGFSEGSEVSRYYDSMIAKIIAFGPNRTAATRRLDAALNDAHVLGVTTNIPYLLRVIGDPAFASAEFDTGFLGRRPDLAEASLELPASLSELLKCAGSAKSVETSTSRSLRNPAWSQDDNFRLTPSRS